MKKMIVLILIVALLAVATTPAFAAGGKPPVKTGNGHGYGLNKGNQGEVTGTETLGKGHGKPALKAEHKNGKMPGGNFVLFGTVKGTPEGDKLTINVVSGNHLVQVLLGNETNEDTNETVETIRDWNATGKELTITVPPSGVRIKVFGENGQTVVWGKLTDLKDGMHVRVHGWWAPDTSAETTATEGNKKPTAEQLAAGTWTASQIFEINTTEESETGE